MSGEATALLARALGGAGAPPPSDATSERVLDAALALAAESGLRHLTMDDIAARAGVGRMTVYRRFGDKATLVDALAVREARRCLEALDRAIPSDAPIDELLVEAFIAGLRIAREHPLLNRLARLDPGGLLRSLNADGGALFGLAREFAASRLRAVIEPAEPAAEMLLRVGVSFVLLQDSVLPLEDEDALRELARRLIAPVVAQHG